MIRRPPRSTQSRSSAASDVYKRQVLVEVVLGDAYGRGQVVEGVAQDADPEVGCERGGEEQQEQADRTAGRPREPARLRLSLIHISEPTRLGMISYAVFCLKKKKKNKDKKTIEKILKKKKKNKNNNIKA